MIYHICRKEDYLTEENKPFFGEREMKEYGFIHSSKKEGLDKILPRFMNDIDDYLILSIEEKGLADRIVYEEKDVRQLYPHFYELIPSKLIVGIEELSVFLADKDH